MNNHNRQRKSLLVALFSSILAPEIIHTNILFSSISLFPILAPSPLSFNPPAFQTLIPPSHPTPKPPTQQSKWLVSLLVPVALSPATVSLPALAVPSLAVSSLAPAALSPVTVSLPALAAPSLAASSLALVAPSPKRPFSREAQSWATG